MNFIRLLPVFISFLLISAHFQRSGSSFLAVACLLAPGLLFFTRPYSVRIVQLLLGIAALEWIKTLLLLVNIRMELEMPWIRLAAIIGTVALLTAASALVFRHNAIKKKYNISE